MSTFRMLLVDDVPPTNSGRRPRGLVIELHHPNADPRTMEGHGRSLITHVADKAKPEFFISTRVLEQLTRSLALADQVLIDIESSADSTSVSDAAHLAVRYLATLFYQANPFYLERVSGLTRPRVRLDLRRYSSEEVRLTFHRTKAEPASAVSAVIDGSVAYSN